MNLTRMGRDDDLAMKESYVWEVPGKPVSIEIDFDMVDLLAEEIQRGSDASRKSGLEVGGILLGTAEAGAKLVARIEDFEPIACSYADGPSYSLGAEERRQFEQAVERWRPTPDRRLRAIGFYRAHTREGLLLDRHDRELIRRYFPEDTGIVLLIKPYATRAAKAGFFFKEGGTIRSDASPREFPFRRAELGGGGGTAKEMRDTVKTSTLKYDFAPELGEPNEPQPDSYDGRGSEREDTVDTDMATPEVSQSVVPKRTIRLRGGWVWVPLSFVFLLLGTILGFQVALSVRSKVPPVPDRDPYALSLSVTPSADSVHLRWDRSSPAIKLAEKGILVIHEDGKQKNVDLDAGHLRNGSVIYRKSSDDVSFRLEVFMKQRITVSETVEFRPVTATTSPDANGA